jgi:putative DNA primase/helicase
MTKLHRAARRYAEEYNCPVFPLGPRRKQPAIRSEEGGHGYLDATTDLKQIDEWWKQDGQRNIGIPASVAGMWDMVLDVDGYRNGDLSLKSLEHRNEPLPPTRQQRTGSGGESCQKIFKTPYAVSNSAGEIAEGLDIRGTGGYIVVPPSIHPRTGNEYEWDGIAGFDAPIAEAPDWFMAFMKAHKPQPEPETFVIPEKWIESTRNDSLYRAASALRGKGLRDEVLLAGVRQLNQDHCVPPLSDVEVYKVYKSASKLPTNAQKPPRFSPPVHGFTFAAPAAPKVTDLLHKYDHSDPGNGQRILALCGENMLWCDAERSWYVWDGRRWERGANTIVRRFAHLTARTMYHQAIECTDDKDTKAAFEKTARAFHNTTRLSAALYEAHDAALVRTDQFDLHPHLLNFRNGTVDLRSGELKPADRADRLTKVLDYDYDPQAECPLFNRFLEETMNGDMELGRDLTRMLGYSLTGETCEKAVMLCCGPKDTGKTTLLNLLRTLLGDYATTVRIDSLMTKDRNNAVEQDLWDLAGRRFVMTSETNRNEKMAVARLKQITQGQGVIKVIPKFKDSIEFPETHKLWMDCNYLPVVRGEDDIWERLHPIDFTNVVPPAKQDKKLYRKLLKEASGILGLLVRAAGDYYSHGFPDSRLVRATRDRWRSEANLIRQFLEERCFSRKEDHNLMVQASALWNAYIDWAKDTEQPFVYSSKEFPKELEQLGFTRGLAALVPGGIRQRIWWGISFKKP